jgi:hypothetical protein
MTVSRNLSYAQLNEAYSWLKSQDGEDFVRLEDEGADLTEVMIRLGNGAYRSPLARIIDRGSNPEELAIQAEEDEASDMDDFDCSDDDGDDVVYDDYGIDDVDTALWHERIRRIGNDQALRSAPKTVVADDIHEEVALETCALAEHDSVDLGPKAISGWLASLTGSVDELRLDNGTGGYSSWKDTTKSPTQFMRHAGRIQPTFRRKQARAA